ncbi:hypothetical protein VTJ83DRAFT_5716 [Remersonia thermophila]|uniref:Glutamyl-tRNA synthetase n=1 Tax=Remersonia thermophila TaxID=72144 RepID=A0ABR4D7M3_9PEZI
MSQASLPPLPDNYTTALRLIDEAHAQDPRPAPSKGNDGGADPVPFELDYAQKMTHWLAIRKPDASPALQLACRAQHFRRWEIPRSNYPATRSGYLLWRARQKSQGASLVAELLAGASSSGAIAPPLGAEEIARVAALVRKEGLAGANPDPEAQALEDAACLVFLDDQLESWFAGREDVDEDKMVGILRKTWGKMSEEGRKLALGLELGEGAKALVKKALEGDGEGEGSR